MYSLFFILISGLVSSFLASQRALVPLSLFSLATQAHFAVAPILEPDIPWPDCFDPIAGPHNEVGLPVVTALAIIPAIAAPATCPAPLYLLPSVFDHPFTLGCLSQDMSFSTRRVDTITYLSIVTSDAGESDPGANVLFPVVLFVLVVMLATGLVSVLLETSVASRVDRVLASCKRGHPLGNIKDVISNLAHDRWSKLHRAVIGTRASSTAVAVLPGGTDGLSNMFNRLLFLLDSLSLRNINTSFIVPVMTWSTTSIRYIFRPKGNCSRASPSHGSEAPPNIETSPSMTQSSSDVSQGSEPPTPASSVSTSSLSSSGTNTMPRYYSPGEFPAIRPRDVYRRPKDQQGKRPWVRKIDDGPVIGVAWG